MSNSYFRFKQFLVKQDKTAMKVSTDACIQGAWTPISPEVHRVLDIGTGTGLLSLMLAQRNNGLSIDAIELDENAARQATDNIATSPWADSIHVMNSDIRNISFSKQYDLIICNPPFFQKSLLGNRTERNQARHDISLKQGDLFSVINRYLKPEGYASVLLPFAEYREWETLLNEKGWVVFHKLFIKPKIHSNVNRIVGLCAKGNIQKQEETLIIYERDGVYTPEFANLLRPFYLNL